MKYVLFVPTGGFNDILCGLGKSVDYCNIIELYCLP
jgi:hypothetical protein